MFLFSSINFRAVLWLSTAYPTFYSRKWNSNYILLSTTPTHWRCPVRLCAWVKISQLAYYRGAQPTRLLPCCVPWERISYDDKTTHILGDSLHYSEIEERERDWSKQWNVNNLKFKADIFGMHVERFIYSNLMTVLHKFSCLVSYENRLSTNEESFTSVRLDGYYVQ
jgi:hypothetical protein